MKNFTSLMNFYGYSDNLELKESHIEPRLEELAEIQLNLISALQAHGLTDDEIRQQIFEPDGKKMNETRQS